MAKREAGGMVQQQQQQQKPLHFVAPGDVITTDMGFMR